MMSSFEGRLRREPAYAQRSRGLALAAVSHHGMPRGRMPERGVRTSEP